jgi:hypothetical protein
VKLVSPPPVVARLLDRSFIPLETGLLPVFVTKGNWLRTPEKPMLGEENGRTELTEVENHLPFVSWEFGAFLERDEAMKKFFLKIGAWFALKCRLYYMWSKVYRWFWEDGELKRQEMPKYDDYGRIEEVTGLMQWRKDTWVMLFDAISRPQAAYHRYLHGNQAGDCDDIALYAINRLHDQAVRNGRILKSPGRADFRVDLDSFGLLSCPWIRGSKAGGHNVGIFRYSLSSGGIDKWEWAHVSNWYRGKIRFGFPSKPALVDDILAGEYGHFDPKAESIGWAHCDLNLKLKEYHWSLKL